MGGASDLPPGFHFFPSDEELVVHFLRHKTSILPCQPDIVPTVLLNHHDPWELNGKALQAGNQWYFFSHATQSRVTPNGYWNPICADEIVGSDGCTVGLKKTLIFSIGKPFDGTKTDWVMHEYHLMDGSHKGSSSTTSSSSRKRSHKEKRHSDKESNNWVICRVFDSSCGSQASFHEEGMELSCLDEVFLSLDDYDEVSLPNNKNTYQQNR
ncbi:NAC domain-containing protein 104-like [Phragmites australis]|uniref:NAC domain-containing protein 104-like n=1 Tax=Phragmites australis TaxID=29695 RepID=UPI002D77156F|nr:NAC domain-containing protein 104-like [Phragmites australis]